MTECHKLLASGCTIFRTWQPQSYKVDRQRQAIQILQKKQEVYTTTTINLLHAVLKLFSKTVSVAQHTFKLRNISFWL